MQQLSLHVVGADHPNRDGGNRQFEILLCTPGEHVELASEPRNPVDPNAIAVFSARAVQIGYLTADRAPWVGGMLRNGRKMRAVFQHATRPGAAIRIGFDGESPVLPSVERTSIANEAVSDGELWPDDLPPDD